MRIYVASSWRNVHQPKVVEVLRSAGHEVYDFRNPDPNDPTNDGFRWHEADPEWTNGAPVTVERWRRMVDHPRAVKGYSLDYGAMAWADACVYVLPCGRSASFELGWCMGKGKRCVVVAFELTEPELMLREATIVGSLAEMLDALAEPVAPRRLHGSQLVDEDDWGDEGKMAAARKAIDTPVVRDCYKALQVVADQHGLVACEDDYCRFPCCLSQGCEAELADAVDRL